MQTAQTILHVLSSPEVVRQVSRCIEIADRHASIFNTFPFFNYSSISL